MTVREVALKALASGKALTSIRLAALTGCTESSCGNVLAKLHAEGLADRERYYSGKGGHPAWEYRHPKQPRPRPCCPHCGGEL